MGVQRVQIQSRTAKKDDKDEAMTGTWYITAKTVIVVLTIDYSYS